MSKKVLFFLSCLFSNTYAMEDDPELEMIPAHQKLVEESVPVIDPEQKALALRKLLSCRKRAKGQPRRRRGRAPRFMENKPRTLVQKAVAKKRHERRPGKALEEREIENFMDELSAKRHARQHSLSEESGSDGTYKSDAVSFCNSGASNELANR